MKNIRIGSDPGWVTSDRPQASRRTGRAFTLIELLVVISIMAILAAFTVSVLHGVAINKYRSAARGELEQIENGLEAFKKEYGAYPPSNANPPGTYASLPWPQTNSLYPQLYYELSGVTNKGNQYMTSDGAATIADSAVVSAFGVGGFVNCSKGSGDDAVPARNFLLGLKQARIATVLDNGVWISNLVTSVGGPDTRYMPLGLPNVNPIRYVCPGVNNPQTYDLWVQLVISGKTNLICNWSTATLINNGAP